jgi:hypothetical protein
MAKGMADYRAGRFESAAEWLKKAILRSDSRRESIAYFFLAMAEFQCRRISEAQAAFVQGTELMSKDGPPDGFLDNWVIALHAREEAAKLLGHPPDPPATQASDGKVGGRN